MRWAAITLGAGVACGAPVDDLLLAACDRTTVADCHALGVRFAEGVDATKDEARASQFYRKACKKEHVSSCLNLAGMYLEGRGVQKNLARADELLGRACTGGDPRGCFNLGLAHGNGRFGERATSLRSPKPGRSRSHCAVDSPIAVARTGVSRNSASIHG